MNTAKKYYEEDPELYEALREHGMLDDEISEETQSENIVVNDSLDVDVNLDALKLEGITEEEIDKYFDVDPACIDSSNNKLSTKEEKNARKKQRQTEADNMLVKAFVDNPTHENFNKLWERFYFGVKGHSYKFMHDWDLAADMACQTFTRAWEFRDRYDMEKAKFSTWLYTICRNLCLGELNRKKKNNIVPNDISDMFDSAMLNSSVAMSTDSTQYTMEGGSLTANSVDDLAVKMYDTSLMEIDKLGGNYTKILRMKLVDDMKIREIADELGMNESTVKNYLYKGKITVEEIMKTKHKGLYEMYLEASADEAAKMM
ncbi:MAG: RNA polymerase sigma factor [Hatfieldvirus porci]|uniref:RNA polymerase sigma factor n=1 Tax=phage Lak_Megaphage_RVC_JS4_GC31 TaxID=3109228 RepID=A0ABZ0Z3T5_9CAUD|nr:MAG: RNA polymerase sigma factor [phage Lak_Megaphage_RVC_AP3_GC31]WQJ52759.1 MAG: RNA polymerase sigma factor [phage Lak_Megaphage_RVC_JS4_GC31]